MASTYWVGQDGNIYYGSGVEGAPVENWGSASAYETANDFIRAKNANDTALGQGAGIAYATRIDDPNASTPSPTAPAPTSGSVYPELNQAQIDNTQRTIDEIPGLLSSALATEKTRYGNANRTFDSQEQQQRGTYKESTNTNQLNYDSNFMDSIRAGVKGLSGLFALLRGTGAGGSSVEGEVRDVVGGQTAQDIRGGADTRNENQSELDNSLSTFLSNISRKRQENEDTYSNNQRAVRRDTNTQLQDLYSQMAGFYGDAGQQDQATQWMNKAGELTPQIAQNSRTQLSEYDTSPVQVKAPELTAFARPDRPNIIAGRSPQEVGSGIFSINNRREEEERSSPNLVTAGV